MERKSVDVSGKMVGIKVKTEREIKAEFIDIYKNTPCLWDTANVDYKNKTMREKGYAILTAKLKEMVPDANINVVKRKIDSIRNSYFRERKKVRKSMEENPEAVHVPTLWYYNIMRFLDRLENGGTGVDEEQLLDQSMEQSMEQYLEVKIDPLCNETSNDEYSPPTLKRRKRTSKIEDQTEDLAQFFCSPEPETKQIVIDTTPKPVKTKLNHFAIYLSEQLDQVKTSQRNIAEKLMSDVLFLAKTNQLNLYTRIDNQQFLYEARSQISPTSESNEQESHIVPINSPKIEYLEEENDLEEPQTSTLRTLLSKKA